MLEIKDRTNACHQLLLMLLVCILIYFVLDRIDDLVINYFMDRYCYDCKKLSGDCITITITV